MRKRTKEIAKEQLAVLKEACDSLSGMRDKAERMELLAQMQELAILSGSTIERMEGIAVPEEAAGASGAHLSAHGESDARHAVSLLEQFCETAYALSECEPKEPSPFHPFEMLAELVRETDDFVRDAALTHDVVFLPYNASMWDCMDTVYRAALEDEDANVYVVPIPWYDKNPDGSMGDRHYEADLLPYDVPATHYDVYALGDRIPEYAFIHNPFDEYNHVTSVEPAFYCSKLKHICGTLVYIPYFAFGDLNARMPEAHRLLPGYLYCDYILMQTEQMKNDIDDSIPREKILVAESPKAERMAYLELHRDEIPLPDGWRERIAGKKVIFYNTSVNMILADKEQRLNKIEEMFERILQREELFLLWRPHPLIEATIESMLPHLLIRYKGLQKRFRKEFEQTGRGILDLTGDMERAIAISDAYVGEPESSVIDIYSIADKPRLFTAWQRYPQPSEDELQAERTYDGCFADGAFWFVTHPANTLSKLDPATGKIEQILRIPDTMADHQIRYTAVAHLDGRLYIAPRLGEALVIYDIAGQTLERKYFREAYVQNAFGSVFAYDGAIWLTPMDYPAIVRYDPQGDAFTYFEEPVARMKERAGGERVGSPFERAVPDGKLLYLPSRHTNAVLSFDMETQAFDVTEIGERTNRYRNLLVDGDVLWMDDWNRPLLMRYEKKTGTATAFDAFPETLKLRRVINNPSIPFAGMADAGEEILLFPAHADRAVLVNKETGAVRDLPEAGTGSYLYYLEPSTYTCVFPMDDGRVLAFSSYDGCFVVLDKTQGKAARYPLRTEGLTEREALAVAPALYAAYESYVWPVGKFLSGIAQGFIRKRPGFWKPSLTMRIGAGKEVYSKVTGEKRSG